MLSCDMMVLLGNLLNNVASMQHAHMALYAVQRIPEYWAWYYWLNPFAWSIYGLVASQLGDDFTLSVNTYGFDPDDGPFGQDLYVAQFIYKYYGYDAGFLLWLIPILLGYTAAFWLIASLGLKYLVYISR